MTQGKDDYMLKVPAMDYILSGIFVFDHLRSCQLPVRKADQEA